MSDHELPQMRAAYARQTAEWNRLKERLADLPPDLRIAISLPDEGAERGARTASVPLPPGLRA